MDLKTYRETPWERARIANLMDILPQQRKSVLEIGARDGHISRLLAGHFEEVTALDLEKPSFQIDRVRPIQGDVCRLEFPDGFFDCVICTEVLEHVPDVQKAATEISRVARHEIVVGVPYRQDLRLGRTTCASCLRINPPFGHVNWFDENRLKRLFSNCDPAVTCFVWQNRERTSALAAWLMDQAGNPWGTYHQDEPCIHCGATLRPPSGLSMKQRALAAIAHRLNAAQRWLAKTRPNWIHLLLRRRAA
jgi:ubiquinone/menaquinone biosynthesis C-methylase UbiE